MADATPDSTSLSDFPALEEARYMLSSLAKSGDQHETSGEAAEWKRRRRWCFKLAKALHSSIVAGLGPPPNSPDWMVVKSVLELVVRWGIYPYLSAGVGIPLQKRFKRTAAMAVAAAVSTHTGQESADRLSLTEDNDNACSLFEAAELLSSILLSDQSGAMQLLLLSTHLNDLFAAYLQLGYGPLPTISELKRAAMQRLDEIEKSLPVDHVVEVLLVLLHQKDPVPPSWMSLEAGKMMSRSVMREGGVAAVLERLVGGADARGNLKTYSKVASHLARPPKYVATSDDYYKKICPQLLPLFLLHLHQARSTEGESAFITRTNMQHTAVMIACTIAKKDKESLEKYLLLPLLDPLLCLLKLQNQSEEFLGSVTEDKLVESFLHVQVLLTAGHNGADYIKHYILQKTLLYAPSILGLQYLLEALPLKVGIEEEETRTTNLETIKPVREALRRGFSMGETLGQLQAKESDQKDVCNKVQSSTSLKVDCESTYECFKAAVTEFASAHVAQPAEYSLPVVLAFEEKKHFQTIEWPTAEGRIANALGRGERQSYKVPMFVSNLILTAENWELALCLMSKLMFKIAQLKNDFQFGSEISKSKLNRGSFEFEEMLAVTHFLETILDEIGARALEKDIVAAVSFFRDLMHDSSILRNKDSVDIALQMIQRLVYKICERNETIEHEFGQNAHVLKKRELLASLLFVVERVLFCSGNSDRVMAMATSLHSFLLQSLRTCE